MDSGSRFVLFPAGSLENRVLIRGLAVLTVDLDVDVLGGRAEVDRVDEEALVAAIEAEGEFGDGGVGDGIEGGAELAVDRFDVADEVDVDLAFEVGDDVGELSFATVGAQIDGAFERLFKQRGFSLGVAEERSGGTLGWPDNWTLVQGLLMWALSRNSECGRVTETRETLA